MTKLNLASRSAVVSQCLLQKYAAINEPVSGEKTRKRSWQLRLELECQLIACKSDDKVAERKRSKGIIMASRARAAGRGRDAANCEGQHCDFVSC
jgi:hypothetical protein